VSEAKSLFWIRVSVSVWWNVAVYQLVEPLPGQVVFLTASLQHAPPGPIDLTSEAAKPIVVSSNKAVRNSHVAAGHNGFSVFNISPNFVAQNTAT